MAFGLIYKSMETASLASMGMTNAPALSWVSYRLWESETGEMVAFIARIVAPFKTVPQNIKGGWGWAANRVRLF